MKKQKSQERIEQEQAALKEYIEQLDNLQTEINQKDAICVEHGKVTLKLAIEAGKILNNAYNIVGHGEWTNWVTENIKTISLRTVQNYKALAYEERDRQRCIDYDMKQCGKTQHVSLLEECSNIREAYRAVGIIKALKRGRVEEEGEKEKQPSPEQLKKDNPNQYNQNLETAKKSIGESVQEMFKDNKEAIWDFSQWTVDENDKPPFRHKGTARLLNDLVEYVAGRSFKKQITHADETGHKAGTVFRELFKAMIGARQKPSATRRPEDFAFEVNKKRTPKKKSKTPETTIVDSGQDTTPPVETKDGNTEKVVVE